MSAKLHLPLGLYKDKQQGLFVINDYLPINFQTYGNKNMDYMDYIVQQRIRIHKILVSHSFAIMY